MTELSNFTEYTKQVANVYKSGPTVRDISEQLSAQAESVAAYLLPAGKRRGNKWLAGPVFGEEGESLSVVLNGDRVGRWMDHASTDHHGDLLDLFQLTQSLDKGAAVKAAKDFLGLQDHKPAQTIKPRTAHPSKTQAPNMKPAPDTFRGMKKIHEWAYTRNGQRVGCVARFEDGQGVKQVIPFFRADGKPGIPDGLSVPLYGESGRPYVFVVEGEKCVDSLTQMGLAAITWQGGSGAVYKADWGPLKGKKTIYLLPDNDEPGGKCMAELVKVLQAQDRDRELKMVDLDGLPAKGDIVDWIQARVEGWDGYAPDERIKALKGELREAVKHAIPIEIERIDEKPYMPDESPSKSETGEVLGDFRTHNDLVNQRLTDGPLVGALMQKPTEDNVALAFAENCRGDYVYLHGHGKWFHWGGRRFCCDITGTVRETVRQLARAHNVEGNPAPAKNAFITGVLGVCMTDPTFRRDAADFDGENYLLNCPDATYNLRDMTRHEHDPKDHITLMTAVPPNPKGGERFLKFLQEIFDGDQELIDWVQMALGACLSGAIEDHWLMFWTGGGRNGKNTLGDLVLAILGDYAKAVPAETLMSRKNQEHKTEIMNLKGVRLAVASEIEESDFWSESKLKSLTGDAVLSGRFMRQDFVHFERTHKHLIYGNHRPQLRNVDAALRSRLKIVPFNVSFIGREDAELPAKLWTEAEYVLHWLIEGHKEWMQSGRKIGTCPALEAEADDYFSMQATVETWLEERCRQVTDERSNYEWVQANRLYKDYKDWCEEMGIGARSQPRFGERLQAIGFERVKSNGYRYVGLELRELSY